MNKNLILTDTKEMSAAEWLGFRKKGIGASEVGTVMGLNPYKSSIELFYDKIGEGLGYSVENIAMFMGKEQEPLLARMWEHWEGSTESMIENYRTGKVVRRAQRVNAYVNNPKYPWLFVSLDRKINKHANLGEGALELKTIASYAADKWEHGIPPSHVVQVQTQLLVSEFEYGELATLKNGRDFDVLPFEFSSSITGGIIDITKKFWDKVEEARKVMTQRFEAQRTFNYKAVEELNAQLQTIEPEPDGSDAYNSFMKEKYRIAIPGERAGTLEQLVDAKAHKEIGGRIKELEGQKQLHENRLKAVIRDGADKLDWGAEGFVSWKVDTNGTRRFLNKVKAE